MENKMTFTAITNYRSILRNSTLFRKLKKLGYRFAGPGSGYLACGCEGIGRLASTEEIVAAIERLV